MVGMRGTRLEFVAVPIKEPVKRVVVSLVPRGKNKDGKVTNHDWKREVREQEGGYMVYFPRGHVLRIKNLKMLKFYGLDRQPRIINMEGLNDPNTPFGKFMSAQDAETRHNAWGEMEQKVIKAAQFKSGPHLLTQVEEIAA